MRSRVFYFGFVDRGGGFIVSGWLRVFYFGVLESVLEFRFFDFFLGIVFILGFSWVFVLGGSFLDL